MTPETLIVAARLAQYAGATVLSGSPLFYLYGLPAGGAGAVARWPRPLVFAGAVLALAGAVAALMVQTAILTADPAAALRPADMWSVIDGTGYGLALAVRIGLAGAALVAFAGLSRGAPRTLWAVQAALGAGVMASFAWTGHGAASEGVRGLVHLAADILHLLAAAIWLGALAPLAIIALGLRDPVPRADALALHAALGRFSAIGVAVVGVIAATGVVNGWFLVGPAGVGELFRTGYGRVLLAKLVLFVLMLGLAGANRLWLAPRYGAALAAYADPRSALAALRASVASETLLALAVLAAVAVLGTLEPISAL
jgi:putative copper resistance protein D